jgi:hypothetical protein
MYSRNQRKTIIIKNIDLKINKQVRQKIRFQTLALPLLWMRVNYQPLLTVAMG